MDVVFFAKVFAALFAIMSPLANLPVFLSLTADMDQPRQRRVARTVVIGLVIGCTITVLAGTEILKLFGIGIQSFRLAGGLLILLIALTLLRGQQPRSHAGNEKERERYDDQDNPGIYPMTVPILLGPGAISTMIIYAHEATATATQAALGLAIAANIALLGGVFLAAPHISKRLSATAIAVMSRLMGMILAAIAMEMMTGSLLKLFPGLAGSAA